MNRDEILDELLFQFFADGITITNIKKTYHKGLKLIITVNGEFNFTINITDNMRKVISYHLNDLVKMNITHKDIKRLLGDNN